MTRGEQIYVMREFLNFQGVYEHHGINCGDGTVIHYRKPSETIERTSMATFTRGGKLYQKQYKVGYIADTTIARAQSRLGEQKYNLLFNNCEHFATWCKTGASASQQILNFIPFISHINPEGLYEPLKQAIEGSDRPETSRMLHEALTDIKTAWNGIQPEYNDAIGEMKTWERVAREALKKDREDLARAALHKKHYHKRRAQEFKNQLDRLAKMTETLVRELKIIE
ncbi:lecithin retinol acyltransferase family protein [Oscillatoriales cyanobacterium LEGE 11467]|uniref:Lecithin retinol acyltransferase family protein n=1 Tax=Zarconia navalis LEGE 11467 TaxID=1828826 RepID=A0A928VZP1_9CYAN|nr:lecithin retinol acyltransferase family protein [Zarconia navalis]MBE9042213.1 lecithin retinol acyltransferase family protein [Zarconia navalis LEGE 11467]